MLDGGLKPVVSAILTHDKKKNRGHEVGMEMGGVGLGGACG